METIPDFQVERCEDRICKIRVRVRSHVHSAGVTLMRALARNSMRFMSSEIRVYAHGDQDLDTLCSRVATTLQDAGFNAVQR